MANILTTTEASNAVRCLATDQEMIDLLPQVDSYVRGATGHDWAADTVILPLAKSAARMLLVLWYENPGMIASGMSPLNAGLTSTLTQLEALAGRYRNFTGRSGAGAVTLEGVAVGDSVNNLVGLIGATGDQSAAFETVITVADQIQQVSASDLSAKWFRAYLIPPEGL